MVVERVLLRSAGQLVSGRNVEGLTIPNKHRILPSPIDWKGPLVLLAMVFVLSSFLDNIAAALIGGTMAQSSAGAHRHPTGADMLAEIAAGVTFVRVDSRKIADRENICRSKGRRYIAFTTSGERERLFITDTRHKIIMEVRGIPLEFRPFSDLRWTTQNRLKFDRWSQPHHGMHYELDVTNKRLVVAYAFPG